MPIKRRRAGSKPRAPTRARKLSTVPPSPDLSAAPAAELSSPLLPIVGVGASAGGLEALDAFLRHVPVGSGMAVVVVQHLDPTHKGVLAELLQRATTMKVVQVKDRTRVQPNCVYVIPPNKDMSILHGVLHLLDPVAPRGLRLPIDLFFRSLAEDAQERSIGVVLSGMGTDGTLGIKAIKGKAGAVFVQDPASAKFDGMPRSAVESGVADVVAPVESLPDKILSYIRRVPGHADEGTAVDHKHRSAIEKIVLLLRAQTGHDFSLYKRSTVLRRVERRMAIHQLDRIAAYVRLLQEDPGELKLLFNELLIGVTSFFRDSATWDELRTKIVPLLLKNRPAAHPLRIWIPGCSTGEEAYSMAITFREVIDALSPSQSWPVNIFATDLDGDAIDRARTGVYPANIAADVSPERLERFFTPVDGSYQIARTIREGVVFARQNVVMDPPFTRLDLISCRNLLIYLTSSLQKTLLQRFHFSLSPGGFLFLGNAETVGGLTEIFSAWKGDGRFYRRVETRVVDHATHFPSAFHRSRPEGPMPLRPTPTSLQSVVEQVLIDRFSPAAILVNTKGDILHISGRTGKYLEAPAGRLNWNVFAMARTGLRTELTSAFRLALKKKHPVVRRSMSVKAEGRAHEVDLTVQVLGETEPLRDLVMIVLSDVATPRASGPRDRKGARSRSSSAQRELALARRELETLREEMRISQQDASSAYEELQSANEEIQSTNEELTTSKEEMQSMNEELQTINHELQAKVDDAMRLNNDMKNLLENTEVTSVFLDRDLRVRLFTAGSSRILKLIPGDVGRPMMDITSDLVYPGFTDDARSVMRTLAASTRVAETRDGRRFQVRMMPYRTLANTIDGVVITYSELSPANADGHT